MTKEQLLIPRVLCIGGKPGDPNYPGSRFMTGDIIEQNGRDYWGIKADAWISQTTVDRYPNLFKPLPWWYGRTVEEMPEYVKTDYKDSTTGDGLRNGVVFKVEKWVTEIFICVDGLQSLAHLDGYKPSWLHRFPEWENGRVNACHLIPADESEYQEYQKQKQ